MPLRPTQYRLKIEAYSPQSIPMARLAEYMTHLANLLGERERVHFLRLEPGSLVLVSEIEVEALPKVDERVRRIREGNGPNDAMEAFRSLNRKLKEDNGRAVLFGEQDALAELIIFPGRDIEAPVTFGAFNQQGSIDGRIIMVGGKKDPVPVHVEEEETVHLCLAPRAIAKELGKNMFEVSLRLYGTGHWYRNYNGAWILERFLISSFETLDDEPLSTVVSSLRAIEGSEWDTLKDPWAELQRIRNEGHSKSK